MLLFIIIILYLLHIVSFGDMNSLQNDVSYIREKTQTLSYELQKVNDALNALGMVKILAVQGSINDLSVQLSKVRTFNDDTRQLHYDMRKLHQLLEPISALANEKIKNDQIDAKVKEAEFKLKLAQVKATDQLAWKHYEESGKDDWTGVWHAVGGAVFATIMISWLNANARPRL